MKRTFTASISREDDWYVAQCAEPDIASRGKTKAHALANLREAVALHLGSPIAAVALIEKPSTWDGFFAALAMTDVPDDFLSEDERDQGVHDRDPFEGWRE